MWSNCYVKYSMCDSHTQYDNSKQQTCRCLYGYKDSGSNACVKIPGTSTMVINCPMNKKSEGKLNSFLVLIYLYMYAQPTKFVFNQYFAVYKISKPS